MVLVTPLLRFLVSYVAHREEGKQHNYSAASSVKLEYVDPQYVIRPIQEEIPVARDDACKEWQEVSTQSVQTDDVKGNAHICKPSGDYMYMCVYMYICNSTM